MATFDDLIAEASPALAEVEWPVTEGKSWATSIIIPADLTGVTGECKALEAVDGPEVIEITVSVSSTDPDAGVVTLTAEPPDTDGVAGDSPGRKRVCPFYLTLTKGTQKVAVWGVQESRLIISQGE